MLKTITTTKQMRLDELIKHIFENNIKNKYFYSEQKKVLEVDMNGKIIPKAHFNKSSLFPVEIEEEITEDTEFELLVKIYKKDKKYLATRYYGYNLNEVVDCDTDSVYAFIDGKLELIYKKGREIS